MFLLWDSIGYECEQDSFKTFVRPFAAAMDCEVGRDTNGGQGCTVPGFGVSTASQVWSDYHDGASRLIDGRLSPPPDYIVIGHGTNDFLRGGKDDAVTAAVVSTLTGLRAAVPAAKIVVVVPFGGYKRDAITAGFKQYVAASGDKQTMLTIWDRRHRQESTNPEPPPTTPPTAYTPTPPGRRS